MQRLVCKMQIDAAGVLPWSARVRLDSGVGGTVRVTPADVRGLLELSTEKRFPAPRGLLLAVSFALSRRSG